MIPPERIESPRLVLRSPRESFRDALDQAVRVSLPDLEPVFRWAQVQVRLHSEQDASAHLLDRVFAWQDRTAWTWFAFDREHPGDLVAEICLKTANQRFGALEYIVWVRSDRTGRGYGTEASDAVLEMAFGELGIDLIEARVAPGNPRSRRMLTRLGFQAQGTLWDYDRLVLFPEDWARSLYKRRIERAGGGAR